MVEKEDFHNVLDIFISAQIALQQKNTIVLKELSNRTIHTASTAQDSDSIMIAVIMYSLSKVVERSQYQQLKGFDQFYKTCNRKIERAIEALKRHNHRQFFNDVRDIQRAIYTISGNLQEYVEDVFMKAKINKASKIYEHGISMGKTAKLLGISPWELSRYLGQKTTPDVNHYLVTMDARKRAQEALKLFS